MLEPISKNTEVVGVSDALKQLATKKTSPVNSLNPPLQKQSPIDDGTIMGNQNAINPSSSLDESTVIENGKVLGDDDVTQTCGWWKFRPKFLRRFMNPHYALAFLCLAGAIQGL